MGLSIDEFWRLSWVEYEWLCRGYSIKQELRWVQTREIMAMLYNVNRGKNSPVKTGVDFIQLSIDPKKEEMKPLSVDEHNELIERYKQQGIL